MSRDYIKIFDSIIEDIIERQMSVRTSITNHHVSWAKFFKVMDDFPEKEKQYTRALELRTEIMADEILEIADDKTNDSLFTDKGEKENKEWINRSKTKIDTRKWLMAKRMPKKYGDKLNIDQKTTISVEQPLFADDDDTDD